MLPKQALTDIDLIDFGKQHFRHFRGVFMRDRLPKKPWTNECDLQPPIEIVKYLKPPIEYNYRNEQKFNTYNCGHLCLTFLFQKNKM